MSDVAVIGEAVADAFLPTGRAGGTGLELRVHAGGGPVNTAVALSRLGTRTRFLGRLANGPFGDLSRRHLIGSGVDIGGCVDAVEQATLAITGVDARGQATYEFYAERTADWQWTRQELAARRPDDVSCVHTGSLALVRRPGGPLIEDLLEQMRPSATISIDPNLRPLLVAPERYRARLPRWGKLADVLRLSDEDLGYLCPGVPLERACDDWHGDGIRLVVITQGAEGAFASLDGARVTVPAMKIEPVDTVGAGDAFNAGLLHWLHRRGRLGGRLEDVTVDEVWNAMAFATRVAARTCEVAGADPPLAQQVPYSDEAP